MFDSLTFRRMVARPQCFALRLYLSQRTTIIKMSNAFASINWVFEDTMCLDAPLSWINVHDSASNWLSSNWVMNKNYVLPPVTLFGRSSSDLLGLDWHSLVNWSSLLQLKYMPFSLFLFLLLRAYIAVFNSSSFLLAAFYSYSINVNLLMSLGLCNAGPFINISTIFKYLNMHIMEKYIVVMKSLSMTFVLVLSPIHPQDLTWWWDICKDLLLLPSLCLKTYVWARRWTTHSSSSRMTLMPTLPWLGLRFRLLIQIGLILGLQWRLSRPCWVAPFPLHHWWGLLLGCTWLSEPWNQTQMRFGSCRLVSLQCMVKLLR